MLEDFVETENVGVPLERILIAKAIIKFPFEYSGDYKQFDYYATNLYPCKRAETTSGSRIYTPLAEIDEEDLETGYIDRSNLCYTANISMYLQNLISRKASEITQYDDLWIMPTIALYNSYTGETYYYADYYYYTQSRLNGTADARHPVLQLTYTILL
jgi:hypothetical protein